MRVADLDADHLRSMEVPRHEAAKNARIIVDKSAPSEAVIETFWHYPILIRDIDLQA